MVVGIVEDISFFTRFTSSNTYFLQVINTEEIHVTTTGGEIVQDQNFLCSTLLHVYILCVYTVYTHTVYIQYTSVSTDISTGYSFTVYMSLQLLIQLILNILGNCDLAPSFFDAARLAVSLCFKSLC